MDPEERIAHESSLQIVDIARNATCKHEYISDGIHNGKNDIPGSVVNLMTDDATVSILSSSSWQL